jgi:hypothetical protein
LPLATKKTWSALSLSRRADKDGGVHHRPGWRLVENSRRHLRREWAGPRDGRGWRQPCRRKTACRGT